MLDNTYGFFVARVVSFRAVPKKTGRPYLHRAGPVVSRRRREGAKLIYFTVTLIVAAIWPP
jgi:hypothetical protein